MSAKGILAAAYQAQIVPAHLKGKTQQKTLQARLSEDILRYRSYSRFYRTAPGMYFLWELVSAPETSTKHQQPFRARRRTRDLKSDYPLGIHRSILKYWGSDLELLPIQDLFHFAEKHDALLYLPASGHVDYAVVRTFSLVRRFNDVLTYRVGRYRDDRDTFANKKTIGFPGTLSVHDRTLFSLHDYGVTDNALNVLHLDLDLSPRDICSDPLPVPTTRFTVEAEGYGDFSIVLIVMEWSCPRWFEPTTRRLSLNSPNWLDLSVAPNDFNDFEPWSQTTFRRILKDDVALT